MTAYGGLSYTETALQYIEFCNSNDFQLINVKKQLKNVRRLKVNHIWDLGINSSPGIDCVLKKKTMTILQVFAKHV